MITKVYLGNTLINKACVGNIPIKFGNTASQGEKRQFLVFANSEALYILNSGGDLLTEVPTISGGMVVYKNKIVIRDTTTSLSVYNSKGVLLNTITCDFKVKYFNVVGNTIIIHNRGTGTLVAYSLEGTLKWERKPTDTFMAFGIYLDEGYVLYYINDNQVMRIYDMEGNLISDDVPTYINLYDGNLIKVNDRRIVSVSEGFIDILDADTKLHVFRIRTSWQSIREVIVDNLVYHLNFGGTMLHAIDVDSFDIKETGKDMPLKYFGLNIKDNFVGINNDNDIVFINNVTLEETVKPFNNIIKAIGILEE